MSHRAALSTALFVTVLWSSSWVLVRIGIDDESLTPLTFAGLRYVVAGIVLSGVALAHGRSRAAVRQLSPRRLGRLVVLGLVFYAVTQGAQFVAIANQPAATSSLVWSMTPLGVAVFGRHALGEHTVGRQVVGAVLVVAGSVAYFAGDLGATAVGMAAAGVGLTANVASSLLGRSINRSGETPVVVVTAVSMVVGSMVLAGIGIAIEGVPALSPRALVIIGWLAVVNTALAFSLWNLSLRRLSAFESSTLNNTMLVQIALLAWAFLGESPGPLGLVGVVVVSIGIWMAQRSSHP